MTPVQKIALTYVLGYIDSSEACKPYKWVLHDMLAEARRTVSGQEAVAFPAIKGAWIDGGYVIVTPAGTGNAPALKEAILKAAAPIPATEQKEPK